MWEQILPQILDRMRTTPNLAEMLEAAAEKDNNLVVTGLHGGATPALLALVGRELKRPLLIVTSSLERAETITDGLAFFGCGPLIFPGFETLPHETTEAVLHIIAARNRVLGRLVEFQKNPQSGAPLIVAPIDALCYLELPREALEGQFISIQWGQTLDAEELAHRLVAMGYRREALVESPGEFAIRGSIIDVYPPDADLPWRIDLFGEEVEQLRRFDPGTQRSEPRNAEIETIRLLPAACHQAKLDHLARDGALAPIFDLLPEDTLIVRDGPTRLEQRLIYFQEIAARHTEEGGRRADADGEGHTLAAHGLGRNDWLLDQRSVEQALEGRQHIDLADIGAEIDDDLASGRRGDKLTFQIATRSFESIPSKFDQYLGLFRERLRKGEWVLIVCDNNGQVMRLEELLAEHELQGAAIVEGADEPMLRQSLPVKASDRSRMIMLTTGQLHEGFQSHGAGLFIVTDREIFGRYKRRHIYRRPSRGKGIANPNEINRGDFVVHVEHGIGRFETIRRQKVDGRLTEFMEIIYQDQDKLLVPVDKLHMVQKYAAAEGKEPTLDKLGSKKWQKRCKKSMEAVRKMAGELLELYARREAAEGSAYGADTIWQREFEASFIYQETPDQIKAIEQVKEDMTQPKPMDRLVCGDVGYGKTEVAIRAAFKALVEGRQVAILAPTTLLVQQHYNTFRERFADYPFRVEMLSRFRSAKQQSETIKGLAEGEVNLVVGTHRLLSRDIKFRDLGLLVVDEEQRFGVAQKEKIKGMRANVDILTLSATPIPRTLYMALSGLRDLSIITTPPADRHPIKTRTIRFDREFIEEAILRELNRGGQVYFVHNRVQSIQGVSETLKEIVPQARIAVAHGQMEETELEKIMIDFIEGNYDILLSTTIIENGIDIPNVNTIIINRADAFGLSQLYQLRGRVGRDVRQAYAYLILPPGQAITPAAIKRLEALEEFTELGVGFSIAMRDMEIRGTGNILGREQHGAITDIGYEMYCRMLEEAVREMKGGGALEPLWPTEVKWPVEQLLTEEFIPIESQRIRFYKDIAAAHEKADIDSLVDELVDRYGPMPPSTVNLINATRLKLAGAAWRVDTFRYNDLDGTVRVKAPVFAQELAKRLFEMGADLSKHFSRLRRQGDQVVLTAREWYEDEANPEALLLTNFTELMEIVASAAPEAPPEQPAPVASESLEH